MRIRAICHCAVDYAFDNPVRATVYAIAIYTILKSPFAMLLVSYAAYRLYKVLDLSRDEARKLLNFMTFFSRTDSSSSSA
jgi:hypothetical protein